ncbi:MAG: IS1595 family transposase, partial [Dehalococcoidia bacterium]|nr:IS1595 family transposase [Dehalococcoidia bacterium]
RTGAGTTKKGGNPSDCSNLFCPVVGVHSKGIVIPDAKAKTLIPLVEDNVLRDAVIYTDDFLSYKKLKSLGFNHKTVAHSQKVYVAAGDIHTNSVEGFWSQLKRSIDGTYHHVTAKHIQDYVDEYSFRYSHRHDETPMFLTMREQVVKKASLNSV